MSEKVLPALLCVLLLGACSRGDIPAAAAAPGADKPPPLPVTVIEASPRPRPILLEAVGQTEGSRDIELRARVSGILEKRQYREGEPVAAGSTLFVIDPQPFRIALEAAQASLAEEQARLDHARIDEQRLKALLADKAISSREYDDANATLQTQAASTAAALAKVHQAQLDLSYTQVTAPISGLSGRALRSEGSLVTAGTDAALLTTITQTDPIWIRFSLSTDDFARLRANPRNAVVHLAKTDGSPGTESGRINFTGATVDSHLGTVELRAEFANPGLRLLPGDFQRVLLYTGEQVASVVPQAAVVQNDRGRFVWLAGKDGVAHLQPVHTGPWAGNDWLVFDGLGAGDQVIVDNLIKLRPGTAVKAQQAAPAAAAAPPAPAR